MLSPADRKFVSLLSQLAYCNPFLPERLELERQALGKAYEAEDQVAWSKQQQWDEADRPNVTKLTARADQLVDRLRAQLAAAQQVDSELLDLYQDLVLYVLYYRHASQIVVDDQLLTSRKSNNTIAKAWQAFRPQFEHYLKLPNQRLPLATEAAHLFACFFQVRRAFRYVFDHILGDSLPAAEVRATVWQSVFTHDMRRYQRALYNRMRDITTLVTGASGTGKELVAQAIGLAQYIPFDEEKQRFDADMRQTFLPVNLSALSPTLIESELFGHTKGAFTGAVKDRTGWLESCPAHGAIFLDEIGELDALLQVKLLRVVQNRTYSRIGETEPRQFAGKLIAATNRTLAAEIHSGRFREDLYYRLCSDHIRLPSLREHLADRREALEGFVAFIARRIAGAEADTLTAETLQWIETEIGADYAWPGNIRELEQCVRNILVHRHYTPARHEPTTNESPATWLDEVRSGTLSHAELLTHYCTWVYAKLGSYQQTAAALGLDRRTVKAKVDRKLLKEFTAKSPPVAR